jgi:hypothetical protein
MEYKFKYKRLGDFFWNTLTVVGHCLEVEEDKQINPTNSKTEVIIQKPTGKLVVYFKDGSLLAIPKWDECELKLGQDWKLATKLDMEKEIGQKIPLNN